MDGFSLTVSNAERRIRRHPPEWGIRAGALVATACAFGAALALMPWDLALFDEQHVLWQVSSYSWVGVARNLMRDSHPPLYYWLVKGWRELGGFDSPWAYRFFSIVLGLPALPIAFQVGRQWGGRRLGLALVAVLMLNPFYLFLLVLIRMYGLVVALGGLSMFLWARLLRRPATLQWLAWALVQGALMFAHYYGLLLIGVQWLMLLIRRPPGWRMGGSAALPFTLAFAAWIAQAYEGSLENTVRNLSQIPIRPMPWEVLGHLWANLLIGPLADGRLAKTLAVGAGGLIGLFLPFLYSGKRRIQPELAIVALLPLVMGALIALRWPFFAARYFTMSLIPLLALILSILQGFRWKGAFLILILPGLIGVASFPVMNLPVGPVLDQDPLARTLETLTASDPVLAQARWHLLWSGNSGLSSYEWPDPAQRAQGMRRSPSFWFIGVTLYRADWEGWLRGLQATHLIDFQAEFPHEIPEYRASVFHLVRRVPAAQWTHLNARWANGIRLHDVGWTQETVKPGHSVQWHLRFSVDRPLDRRWTLFVHLVDEAGRLWANWDAEPEPPTDQWIPGRVYDIGHSLLVPRVVPAGRYRVHIGWYETGAGGFPRLPLQGGQGDMQSIGEIEILPQEEPPRWGTRVGSYVELNPPQISLRSRPDGREVWVRMQWRSRSSASFAGWQLVLETPDGPVPLQRLYPVPGAMVHTPGWVLEAWSSPALPGGRPALRWLEIRYEGQLLTRRPIWLFPPDVRWSYDWLFQNRTGLPGSG
ncbi:hypothetical protein HRbin22_00623 [Candidatus Thermoflexus japonica]|uniref:Glycosyltransferase RgtA/B/C/D-like domain-containing protein n=1 Tax=Candidatus Thermoflexus japonica TaxID=2035417 RepID=A0A2H5Y4L9_9CHLR|nr:hypothetical protein HRbin22_00623 [Candidatus Thermoflexus japonica]